MQILHTIEGIHKIYETQGSSPLLVTCEDLNDWVCKYDRDTKCLFNELLASEFAQIWAINVPKTTLIKVKPEHISSEKFSQLQPRWFEKECFGSLHIKNVKEIDDTVTKMFENNSFRDKITDKNEFLKIALFDIWLANEDRNHNNFNLLLHISPERFNFFYVIDHVNIFNSSFLDYGISELTEDDSIIKTDLAKKLYGNDKKLSERVNDVVENFYICINKCEKELNPILDLVPTSWDINKQEIKTKINQNLFTEAWAKKCEANFREVIQSNIKN